MMRDATFTCGDLSNGIEIVPIVGPLCEDTIGFSYIKTNIPGPGVNLQDFEEQYAGCSCKGICNPVSCQCLQYFGMAYDSSGKLKSKTIKYSKPVLECGNHCQCDSKLCVNRVVQHGITKKLEVFHTESKGYGLRLRNCLQENIICHSFVCEYAGEVVGENEARSRMQKTETTGSDNYLIVLKEFVSNKTLFTYIDPHKIGNIARFINHSCDPNLIMVPVRVNHSIPRLALFACRDITLNEELTFNYSGITLTSKTLITHDAEVNPCDERSISKQIKEQSCFLEKKQRKQCHCGSNNCSGFLPFEEQLLCV
ncbi:histone-lysine N-methyltransferase SETMAR-like [Physella acuta]|uniref:histone-lysine N-methyltransferase SETMAR-like n=1 Tax=Physella acuta TaxID=109671 RepID=UPI0027DBC231|nr:histone-lysine N-methyltransferase SETMAR-like [Physella acuta]XP_059161282.1 histone-lysine N-methyltransferase SETMAR-like [Physella acuta]XP_059161283.1 histone-lysine N-methyltransferase SETMAR-like [Physella acuta]